MSRERQTRRYDDEMDSYINDLNERIMSRLLRGYEGDPR